MKAALFTATLIAGLWAATAAAQQDAAVEKPAGDKAARRVNVELEDGSLLVGVLPADISFPVRGTEVNGGIAIKWVDTISFSDDHKTAEIEMQNGDRIEGSIAMKSLPLKMVLGDVPVDLSFVKTVNVFPEGEDGLVFRNTLASGNDALHSAAGPALVPYAAAAGEGGLLKNRPPGLNEGNDVAGDREFITGDHDGAMTVKGTYKDHDMVHNLVLGGLDKLINPEQGCIEFWYCEASHPVPNQFGYYRMFDGQCGLGSCAGFFAAQDALQFTLNCGGTPVTVSVPSQQVPDKEWIHLAAVWKRKGIEGTTETVRLYINGKQVAASTNTNWGTVAGGVADICGGQDADCAGKFYMNNLEIWNNARTNFDLTKKPDIDLKKLQPPAPPLDVPG